MNKNNIIHLLLLITLSACAAHRPERVPSSSGTPDYPAIFSKARDYLIKPDPKSKLKKVPESQFVEFLQNNPEWMNESREKLIAEVEANSQANTDLTKHTRLIPPHGQPGYSDVKVYVSHPYYLNGSLQPKDNLIDAWIKFINKAKYEIVVNVFDFDLQEVAKALIKKSKAGLKVQVGVDKGVAETRPQVKAVVDMLIAGGVKVTQVHSVALNHQKVTAIDWSREDLASVLFSSGNLTKSCIEPDGDLKGTVPLPDKSVPNANHLITMKSWILANLVKHELTKTLDPQYLLRGSQYPLSGSYQVTGPGVDPGVLEAYPEPSITIAFSPNGGMKNINKNLISHILKKETGSIRMIQFAFSSEDVEQALLFRAQKDIQRNGKFDFMSVGDTPFAMREWSRFLIMSGLQQDVNGKVKTYSDNQSGAWWKGIGPAQIQTLRKRIYVAPKVYGEHHLRINGAAVKANGKIHHKILATPNFAIVGTSFNFSKGAETNNEQLLVFKDRSMSKRVDGMLKYLVERSPGSVAAEALRRNAIRNFVEEENETKDSEVK